MIQDKPDGENIVYSAAMFPLNILDCLWWTLHYVMC